MGQDDEDIDQLLGEIPRATSASPHYDEFGSSRDGTLSQQEDGSETDSNSSHGVYADGFTTFTPPRAALFDAFGFGLSSNNVSKSPCTTTSQDNCLSQANNHKTVDPKFPDPAVSFVHSPVAVDETGKLMQLHPTDARKFNSGTPNGSLYQSQRHEMSGGEYWYALQQQDRAFHAQKQQFLLLQLQVEEERVRRQRALQQQYLLQQQMQERATLYGLQSQALLAAAVAPYKGRQLQTQRDGFCRQGSMDTPQRHIDSVCRYYAQGFCSRGDLCPFLHVSSGPRSTKVLRKGKSTVSRKKQNEMNGLDHEEEDKFYTPVPAALYQDLQELQLNEQPLKYTLLKEVEGRIYAIAKDQHGCRFLQRKFDEGDRGDIQKIFVEIIDHVVDLMTDPFGNYLVQKLLEVCNEEQRLHILRVVCTGDKLTTISLNMHGTRAVQKLIETLKSPQHVFMITSSLQQGIVTLIKDLNGNHVVQRCLQCLGNSDNQFIIDAAAQHCVEIATHRHGCCVLQRCVDFSKGVQKERLVGEIAANALILSQDQYGNYVVQYILEQAPWIVPQVMAQLEGRYAHLAMQKYSSNVVEKCLKHAADVRQAQIIHELINFPLLGQLLQDPFANYVVQCALSVSKGALHASFVEAIRPHFPDLRGSPYGKKILSRTNLKKA